MMEQMAFSLDLNKCIKCKSCEMACNEYNNLSGIHRRKLLSFESKCSTSSIYLSISCNHCRNPVCVFICPENNFYKRQDGMVIHNSSKCRSCERCVKACPFHAPKINPKTNKADKCNFCVERIDQGLKPICVENCITGALKIVKVKTNKLKQYALNNKGTPFATYTNPSLLVNEQERGRSFLREG